MFIKEVKPSIIKDSRGENTIRVTIKTFKGTFTSSAPYGKSKGKHETPAYNERGIFWSLKLLKVLSEKLNNKNLVMKDFNDFLRFENSLKKFEKNHEKLGANCTYALETSILKAIAKENNLELWEFLLQAKKPKIPMPVGNSVEGGMHSQSSKKPVFQEFLFIPKEETFSRAVTKNLQAYSKVKILLKKKENLWKVKTTDENAWQTSLTEEDVLDIMKQVSDELNLKIGIDIAASTFWKGEKKQYLYEDKTLIRSREEQILLMQEIIEKYKPFYLEDPLQEEDFLGFSKLTSKGLIVGDDLTATNLERLKRAVKEKSINAIIIKPNQNGYIGEVKKVVDFCKENKIKMIFSHRSGETMDDAIADYAIGFGADFVKFGITGRERLIKLRRIMHIEKSLSSK